MIVEELFRFVCWFCYLKWTLVIKIWHTPQHQTKNICLYYLSVMFYPCFICWWIQYVWSAICLFND